MKAGDRSFPNAVREATAKPATQRLAARGQGRLLSPGAFSENGGAHAGLDGHALPHALQSIEYLARVEGPEWKRGITPLVVTCCTGFVAPGVDATLINRLELALELSAR